MDVLELDIPNTGIEWMSGIWYPFLVEQLVASMAKDGSFPLYNHIEIV